MQIQDTFSVHQNQYLDYSVSMYEFIEYKVFNNKINVVKKSIQKHKKTQKSIKILHAQKIKYQNINHMHFYKIMYNLLDKNY